MEMSILRQRIVAPHGSPLFEQALKIPGHLRLAHGLPWQEPVERGSSSSFNGPIGAVVECTAVFSAIALYRAVYTCPVVPRFETWAV
jgi:hypothetical protein